MLNKEMLLPTRLKFLSLFFSVAVLISFISCKKEVDEIEVQEQEEVPQAYFMSDSCSYTIDGQIYIGRAVTRSSKGNGGVNVDHIAKTREPDSVMYSRGFEIEGHRLDDADYGKLRISFCKKYGVNQLTKTDSFWTSIKMPEDELELFKKGDHKFSNDFGFSGGFNSSNGVTLGVTYRTSSGFGASATTLIDFWGRPFEGAYNQDNSKFEVIKLHTLPNGKHVIEAKFSANIYNSNDGSEIPPITVMKKRVENGYVRLHVD